MSINVQGKIALYLTTCAMLSLCAVTPVRATDIFDIRNTCTAPNCGSLRLNGHISATPIGAGDPSSVPWTVQVFARAGECLRLDVVRQQVDLVMAVVAPGGEMFFNDDKGDRRCPLCPRVAIANTPVPGWYTVHVSTFGGVPVSNLFTVRYGLYNRGNPNCGLDALTAEVLPDTAPKFEEEADGPAFDDRAPSVE